RYLATVLIAALALGLSGWNLWGHKPSRKPKDFEMVKNRAVQGFTPAKAKKVTLTRLGRSTTFEKKAGKWHMVKPISFPADHDAVENLLTEIQMLDRDKTLPGPRTKAEYGFGDGALSISVEGATASPLTLTVGGPDVTGAKVYLAIDQQAKVQVVNRHFRETLDKDPGELRDTTALPFKSTDVASVRLTNEDGQTVRLAMANKAWTLKVGDETHGQRANSKGVEDLIRRLRDLRATMFLDDGEAALSKHGLDKPDRTVVVEDGKAHELYLGGPCPKRRDERLAGRRGPHPAVFCLRVKELQELLQRTDDLRDARVVGSDEADVTGIRIAAGGKTLSLKKKGLEWELDEPKGAELPKPAFDQVEAFLKDLRSQTVLTFLPPAVDEATKAKHGLAAPRAVLTLETESGRKEILTVGAESEDKNFFALRSGEELVVVIPRNAGLALTPSMLPFRSRTVLAFAKEPSEAVELTASTGALTEQASYEGGLWQLKKPLAGRADADAMDALLSVLSQLTVVRFLSETPQPEHGLAAPTRTIGLKLEREDLSKPDKPEKKLETHTLLIGADAAGGGCHGQLSGKANPVFLLKADQCRDLRALLATRRVADIRTAKVSEIKLTRDGGVEQLERRGLAWGRKGGPRVDSAAVEGLLTSLASMRASRVVAYGAPAPQHGLGQPQIAVELSFQSKEAKPMTLLVGAALKEGNTVVGHFARVSDRDLVYLLAPADVETIRKTKL
ncbi:MAG: DUF4340 domain-containing protein, partial [Polyangia bacterium]|nr:DUF4340 domain-containing protein [Polyangia bacterium]